MVQIGREKCMTVMDLQDLPRDDLADLAPAQHGLRVGFSSGLQTRLVEQTHPLDKFLAEHACYIHFQRGLTARVVSTFKYEHH